MFSFPFAFKIIPFASIFQQCDYAVSWDGFLSCVTSGFIKFLGFVVYSLHQVWKIFYSFSSNICLILFPNPHMHVRPLDSVLQFRESLLFFLSVLFISLDRSCSDIF